jgi:transposase
VVNQQTKRPLFYRNVPGNISDISALKATVDELKVLGVKQSFVLVDAGFCSEANLTTLREEKIDFLMRLPAGRSLYKSTVLAHAKTMESTKHLVMHGKRTLFVKAVATNDLYGSKGYLYLILDPETKNKHIQDLGIKGFLDDKTKTENKAQHAYDLKTAGIFVLISSKHIPTNEVLSAYYTRQQIEQIFGFSKSVLEIVPIRHHSDSTVKGYLFLQFLLLIVYIELREKLQGHYTVEQALLTLKKLKCKVYEDKYILQEITKKQKEIFKLGALIVPDLICGI